MEIKDGCRRIGKKERDRKADDGRGEVDGRGKEAKGWNTNGMEGEWKDGLREGDKTRKKSRK